jgi:hypothetical protein
MQNAHLRLGRLEYIKPAVSPKSTPTHVTVRMDRVIVEPACDEKQAPRCHLLSVFGGEQEIAAIHAAITDHANFRIAGPDLSLMVVCLGERAHTFRGLIQAPGRRQPVRHLVSVSQELLETQAGANAQADRTVVYSADPEFLVYRLGVRFGIPLLPCWSEWIAADLTRQNRVHPLVGLGCDPVLVKASKQELLNLTAGAVKRGVLSIPDKPSIQWSLPQAFA